MIKEIYFQDFKGFECAKMPIESLATLIGTNASGKSNAIEGMKIIGSNDWMGAIRYFGWFEKYGE